MKPAQSVVELPCESAPRPVRIGLPQAVVPEIGEQRRESQFGSAASFCDTVIAGHGFPTIATVAKNVEPPVPGARELEHEFNFRGHHAVYLAQLGATHAHAGTHDR